MQGIEDIKKEYDEILQKLSDPELSSNWEKFEALNKRKKAIEKITEKDKEIQEIFRQIEENKEILNSAEDPQFSVLAEEEIKQLKEKEKLLREEMENLLKTDSGNDSGQASPDSIIMEIRAGAGGEEAALFAGDLHRMYSKYAESQGWKNILLDSNQTGIGGYKEVIFELRSKSAFLKMKHEAGVHRVQRIPETEKSGRIHTSTASVAVLPKPKAAQIKINPSELRIDYFTSSGPGGQNVNKRETAVRITHIPTGIAVASQTERYQQQNKENAMAILEAKLMQIKTTAEEAKVLGSRKAQIGTADRSEKIRTYNFPQDRLTDHRVKKSWHNLEDIMNGKLDPIIEFMEQNEEIEK